MTTFSGLTRATHDNMRRPTGPDNLGDAVELSHGGLWRSPLGW